VTSNINYLGINENFPVPGEDNDTQVFRDNFDTIKNSLRIARDEVTDLQDNAARTDLDNDFNNKIVQRAVFLNNADKVFDGANPGPVYTIDYEVGNYQIFSFPDGTVLEFQNFPNNSSVQRSVGKVTLELYRALDNPATISFSTSGGTVIKKDSNFPDPLILTSSDNPIFIEVWQHNNVNIFMRYIGSFE